MLEKALQDMKLSYDVDEIASKALNLVHAPGIAISQEKWKYFIVHRHHFMMADLPSDADDIITGDDAAWILANAFLVLTMQTGFGMLEAGSVSAKNVANIMMKNVVDVTLGGLTYWSFGYALSFGKPSNWFCGTGNFFFSASGSSMGESYTHYMLQFSFATTATTIVSGAVAERMKFTAYMVYSALNTFVYSIPASWAWNDTGFLKQLGFFDFAGACVVHLTGGASALVAALVLGPRLGFSLEDTSYGMSSPVTALTGTFMLWWAWLAFNCGSTYGIHGNLWKTAAKVGVTTLNGSIGGSFVGILHSVIVNWKSKIFDIPSMVTSILAGLVSVTASCAVITPLEALVIGSIGAGVALLLTPVLTKVGVDDPVNAVPVHFVAAIWGVVSVGLFGQQQFGFLAGYTGFFHGGGLYLLAVQLLGAVTIGAWSMVLTLVSFLVMKHTIGIRMSCEDEILGADWVEHRVRTENFATKLEKALAELKVKQEDVDTIACKLITELATPNMLKVEGRVRNFTVPSNDSEEEEIADVIRRSLQVVKKMGPTELQVLEEDQENWSVDMSNVPGPSSLNSEKYGSKIKAVRSKQATNTVVPENRQESHRSIKPKIKLMRPKSAPHFQSKFAPKVSATLSAMGITGGQDDRKSGEGKPSEMANDDDEIQEAIKIRKAIRSVSSRMALQDTPVEHVELPKIVIEHT